VNDREEVFAKSRDSWDIVGIATISETEQVCDIEQYRDDYGKER
jgi:hypothetical protein